MAQTTLSVKELKVIKVDGEVLVKSTDGTTHVLHAGDVVHEGDILITGSGTVFFEDPAGGKVALAVQPHNTIEINAESIGMMMAALDSVRGNADRAGAEELSLQEGTNLPDGTAAQGDTAPTEHMGGFGAYSTPKIDYLKDSRFYDAGNLNRDANDVFSFFDRHTVNPRIEYQFDMDVVKFPLYGRETVFSPSRDSEFFTTPTVELDRPNITDTPEPGLPEIPNIPAEPITPAPNPITPTPPEPAPPIKNEPETPPSPPTPTPLAPKDDTNTVTEDSSDAPGKDDSNAETSIIIGNIVTGDANGGSGDSGDGLTVTKITFGTTETDLTPGGSDITCTYGTVTVKPDGSYTYTLDNTRPDVQALAVGEKLTEVLTYTVKDVYGASAEAKLTITINGANDAPEIRVITTDSDSANVTDGDAPLSVTGTLSLYDVDTSNTVVPSVESVTTSGTALPPGITDDDLKDMLTLSGGINSSEQESVNGLNWTFGAAADKFDFLKSDETITLTYTVKATDTEGAFAEHPVTITITGVNDKPVARPDTNSVTEDSPDVSGRDDSNPATSIIIGNVVSGGVSAGDSADSDPEGDSLTVSGISFGGTTGSVGSPLSGSYGSVTIGADGSYTYVLNNNNADVNKLSSGETLTEVFKYTVKDEHDAESTTTLTITINGANDNGALGAAVSTVTPEDSTKTGNALTEGVGFKPDPDNGESVTVTGFKIAGDSTSHNAGDTVTVQSGGQDIGTFTLSADGSYTFTPANNYSGPAPQVTFTASSGSVPIGSSTLDISVTPVSDKPNIAVSPVSTPEDTKISLGLKAPEITDKTDLTGSSDNIDNPERLGVITLSGFLPGTKLEKFDGTELLNSTGTSDTVKIFLTDVEGYHTAAAASYADDPANKVIKMTKSEYEALVVDPAAESGKNFSVTVSATSYEVDNTGAQALVNGNPVPGAVNSANVSVIVKAVTDDVTLQIDGGNSYTIPVMNEDAVTNIKDKLSVAFNDLDGSEIRKFVIDNTHGNAAVTVNGTTVAVGATFEIDAPNLSTSKDNSAIPDINIGAAGDFSGELSGLKLKLVARDSDSETGTAETQDKSAEVSLNFAVMPKGGDVAIQDVTISEDARTTDTPQQAGMKFLQHLEVTDKSIASGAEAEKITAITVKDIPVGWVVKDSSDAVVSVNFGKFTVPDGDITNGNYKNYIIAPDNLKHSSADAHLKLNVTSEDSAMIGSELKTDTASKELSLTVKVTPQAERFAWDSATNKWVTTDTDKDNTPDLTMTQGKNYITEAKEDMPFDINQDGFNFKTDWSNQDGSESTFAAMTPYMKVWNGTAFEDKLAIGTKFEWSGGSGIFNGTSVKIPESAFESIKFTAPENKSGLFEIKVEAYTVDTDEDGVATDTATSGEAWLKNLIVTPQADAVTLNVAQALGKEDTAIKLDIKPTSTDKDEVFNVTISDIPAGAVLTYDGVVLTQTGNSVTIDNYVADKLTVTPPPNNNSDFTLKISSVSVDTTKIPDASNPSGYTELTNTLGTPVETNLAVNVKGVADGAVLTTKSFATDENTADTADGRIALKDAFTASLKDIDGSETLSMVVTGLDSRFDISGATPLNIGTGEDRRWLVTKETYEDGSASVLVKENFSGTIRMNVEAITTENDGDASAPVSAPITITVSPVPEAAINLDVTAKEDTFTKLDLSIVNKGGDMDEKLGYVWFKADDIDSKGVSLKVGENGEAVTSSDDWYKIAASDIENIYAKGPANFAGDCAIDIKYQVTDPSSDGTLAEVTETRNATYTLKLEHVTDDTTTAVSGFAIASGSGIVSDTTVTLTDTASFTFNVNVQQKADSNSTGNRPDVDGSEKLEYLMVDGVPLGVTIAGGSYVGYAPGDTGSHTGRWKIDINNNFDSESGITKNLTFSADRSTGIFDDTADYPIKVTAFSKDGTSIEQKESNASWTLKIEEITTGPGVPYTASTVSAEAKSLTTLEDGTFSLSDLVAFTMTKPTDNPDPRENFYITLSGVPTGAKVEGMTLIDSATGTYRAGYQGGQEQLDSLAGTIKVTLPKDWNDNSGNDGSSLRFGAGIEAVTRSNTTSSDSTSNIDPTITPVTDMPAVTMSEITALTESGAQGGVPITINLANTSDGANANVVGNKVYIQITEPTNGDGGTVTYNGNTVAATNVSGVDGVTNGTYYVLDGVSLSGGAAAVELTYTPNSHASGDYTVKAFVPEQETGASNTETGGVTQHFTIAAENSGYEITAGAENSGKEDERIVLDLSGQLNDRDGSEKAFSATLSDVPDEYLVFVGSNAGDATAAANVGDNTWAITLNSDGTLPAYVAIQPKENASGKIEGVKLNVISGETVLTPIITTQAFDLTVKPVADGITIDPTQAIRDAEANSRIKINLNATMKDLDGSETATIKLSGFGMEGLKFYTDTTAVTQSYSSGTYTLENIGWDEISKLNFISNAAINKKVDVEAWTVDKGAGLTDTSEHVTGSFDVNVTSRGASGSGRTASDSAAQPLTAPDSESAQDSADPANAAAPTMGAALIQEGEESSAGETATQAAQATEVPAESGSEPSAEAEPLESTPSPAEPLEGTEPAPDGGSIDLSSLTPTEEQSSAALNTEEAPQESVKLDGVNPSDLLDSPSDTVPLSSTPNVDTVPNTPDSTAPSYVPNAPEVTKVEQDMTDSSTP